MIRSPEAVDTFPTFWRSFFVTFPCFTEAVLCSRRKVEEQIAQYIAEHQINIPNFSQIQTVEELFATGWRFHTTHWGVLVPPGCPIEHLTVTIHCQVCGKAVGGWQDKLNLVKNPTAYIDQYTGKNVHESLLVCTTHAPWVTKTWEQAREKVAA